ncbi:MAG: hypothetical protein DRO09_00515 [Thermoprotei archaeon]|nr:MAG: hypothetical protein DRO09_00515 [Thermoprotei archaeon]
MERSEIEALKREIREIAQQSCKKIIREAEEKAKRIIEEAERKAKELSENMRNRVLREVREEFNHEITIVKLKYRSELIRLKHRVLEEVFEEASRKIEKFTLNNRGEYKVVLKKLLLEALRDLRGYSRYVIYVRLEDRDLVREVIDELKEYYPHVEFEVTICPIRIKGGVIVYAPEGDIYYNNTFDARLVYIRNTMIKELNSILFGGV